MKIECEKYKLHHALIGVERITAKQLPLPVLSAVLIEAKKDELILKATNLEVSVEYSVPAKINKTGTVAISGRVLSQFLQHLKNDTIVNLEHIEGSLHITTKNTSTLIKTIPFDDFPHFSRVEPKEGDIVIEMLATRFIDCLNKVIFAASQSDIKPEIASVYFSENEEGSLVMTATDSFRLAQSVLPKQEFSKQGPNLDILISIKNISEVSRIISDIDDTITILVTEGKLSFFTKEIYISTRVMVGVNYPNVSAVFPTRHISEITCDLDELILILKATGAFSDKFNRVGLRLIPKENLFEVYAKNQDSGESVMRIEQTPIGEDIDAQFNGKYITDALNVMGSKRVTISFAGQNKPMVIKSSDLPTFIYLIMPLNT